MEAIKNHYTEDIIFYQPDSITKGQEAVSEVAQDLLDNAPGCVFGLIGPVIVSHDMVMLSWGFGPLGDVKVKGTDIMLVENRKIKMSYVVIEGQSELAWVSVAW